MWQSGPRPVFDAGHLGQLGPGVVAPGRMSASERILAAFSKGKKELIVPSLSGSIRAELAAELIRAGKRPVLIAKDHADAEALYRDLAFMRGVDDLTAADHGLVFLGADEKSPYEEYSPDAVAVMERLNTLYRLAREPDSVQAVVVSPRALLRKNVPPSYFDRAGDYLMVGEDIDRAAMLDRLAAAGYNRVSKVEDPGTYSVRGGVVDIYSPHLSAPVRVDLFGDEVESLRVFDPVSQRSGAELEEATLLPSREIHFDQASKERAEVALAELAVEAKMPSRALNELLDDVKAGIHFFGIERLLPAFHEGGLVGPEAYLPRGPEVVYLSHELDALSEQADTEWSRAERDHAHALDSHQLALPPEAHFQELSKTLEALLKDSLHLLMPAVHLGKSSTVELHVEQHEELRPELIRAARAQAEEDTMQPLVDRLKRWKRAGMVNIIACHTRGQAERIIELISPRGLNARLLQGGFQLAALLDTPPAEVAKGKGRGGLRDPSVHAWLVLGDISAGFACKEAGLSIVSEEEIFGRRRKRRTRRAPAAREFVSDLKDLNPGDFIVHVDFGVGQYHGLTKLAVNGVESDFLHIEYKDRDKLYLPVVRLRLISKYMSAGEGKSPKLDKLGGTTWANTKRKVKDTLLKMAAELLRLYAARKALEGFACPAPDEVFRTFEAEFQFEPTPDQQQAIDDVIEDMQKPSPMDRLVCGDVGYGKTEVAMRAAMMAIAAERQVAVLVPTTVLAAQHFAVFTERFKNIPVRIGLVSRFQTKQEVKDSLREAKEGKLDIIIGTHRLLSKDVAFERLGLIVIDEEHRFGVRHKEALKKYRTHVHVLSMSATPIPRTLHMGFMGVRDLSMITTPPMDRLAVKTEVHRFQEEVIKEAILREIKRGGQVFFVHNRVATIDGMAATLEKLVPEARVGIGHGQMSEDRLEQVMVDFMARKFNVLLSTTIIESGIDIPNANTIIINRADNMGLAQLHQLKGRVGRSAARGYAYFLIPSGNLSKDARARIAVLQRFTELGAGFQVASKDLEIRGAGNLLGKQQSGQIAAVGFEMYQSLLSEAVAELKGKTSAHLREPELQVPLSALIPDNYVKEASPRLSYYQRFNTADTDEATYDLLQEIGELYGSPPAEVENLAALMLVKQRLVRVGALTLDYGAQTKVMPPRVVLRFDPEAKEITPEQLVRYIQDDEDSRRLTTDGRLMIFLKDLEDTQDILRRAKEQLDELVRIKNRDAAGAKA